jgi:hypothetical protein
MRRALPLLALFGPHAVSDLSPECSPKRTFTDLPSQCPSIGARPRVHTRWPPPGTTAFQRRAALPRHSCSEPKHF